MGHVTRSLVGYQYHHQFLHHQLFGFQANNAENDINDAPDSSSVFFDNNNNNVPFFDAYSSFNATSASPTTLAAAALSLVLCSNRTGGHSTSWAADPGVALVKYITYGILFPGICALGIVGNVLNLIVLNQPNMKGTAYIYMKGYSSAALMAIAVAIPFAVRVLIHNETGAWSSYYQAFFHTHIELYLGNSCLGIGVMMLVALTLERFVAVCHPEKSRVLHGSRRAYFIISSIPIGTMICFIPHLFRAEVLQCRTDEGLAVFRKTENKDFVTTIWYRIYLWLIALIFRLGPTILLAYLNLRIITAYRKTCANRRRMTGNSTRDDSKKFAEESRIMLLLGSTSVLFFVCVTPMVILSLIISEKRIHSRSFSFEVFRATANFLEVTNYSLTFYIYCLFSREFRNTFVGLFRSKNGVKGSTTGGGRGATAGARKNNLPHSSREKPESTPAEGTGTGGTAAGGSTPLL